MLESKEIEIDGVKYTLTQFKAMKGLGYQKKLAKILLPIISEIVKGEEVATNAFGAALGKLSESLDELEPEFIKELIVEGASKGSMAINFDLEFAGKYVSLFKLVQEIIEYNFKDVFTLVGSSLQA